VESGSKLPAFRREYLTEAAWMAVESHPHWKAHSQRLVAWIGTGFALVAVACKLLVVLWELAPLSIFSTIT
jgi:transposase